MMDSTRSIEIPDSQTQCSLTTKDLRRLHPEVFGTLTRPLRIGIFDDLLAAYPGQLSRKLLFAFLGAHTARQTYLESLAAGGPRYALDGSADGEVTEQEQLFAKTQLEQAASQRADSHFERQARSRTLKAFKSSGLNRKQFAETSGIALSQLDADLSRGKREREERRAKRLRLVEALECSGLSAEDFAVRTRMSVGKIRQAVTKVAFLRAAEGT